ncbi:kinase-like domain-containing protein [Gaertneriomyces semiglobifer]|nr:kinase-like domain-containing protein [Gaertneriomyces semiglobifer]
MSSSTAATGPSNTPPRSNGKNRTCRNVVIHGYCKFEHRGCEYLHPKAGPPGDSNKPSTPSKSNTSPEMKSRLKVDSPVFTPNSAPKPQDGVPVDFLHRLTAEHQAPRPGESYDPRPPVPQASYQYYEPVAVHDPSSPFVVQSSYDPGMSAVNHSLSRMNLGHSMDATGSPARNFHNYSAPSYDSYYGQNVGLVPQQPLQYHLYNNPLPHISNLHPNQKSIHAFFMSDRLREDLLRKNEAAQQVVDTTSAEGQSLPTELHHYHSFCPLDSPQPKTISVFPYPSFVYKAFSSLDGKPYVLRRIEGFRLANESAISAIEDWRRLRHSSIVSVREAFTTKAFGDHSLVFVYDYHPLSSTLYTRYFAAGTYPNPVAEKNLWSFITQIASALKTIHSAGLAARIIEPSKILITGKNRIRLNCCGISDMLTFDAGKNIPQHQQEDLLHFGQLIVALACGSLAAVHNLPKSIEFIVRHNSMDMKNVILYLLSKPNAYKCIDDVVTMIGPRILHEINSAHHYNDFLEGELARELENARLVRLLCKLGFVNERPEFDLDPTWSETGDRYLLKLFRDYVFHQVDETGTAVVDMAHVLQCLNKLDAGVDEKVMLTSRDEQSCLIVSYKELKNCVESTFQDLLK